MAAQSAAQMSALTVMMSRFEEMQPVRLPSQLNQLTTRRQHARPSVLDVFPLTGAPLFRHSPPRSPTSIPHADAHVTLVAVPGATADHSATRFQHSLDGRETRGLPG